MSLAGGIFNQPCVAGPEAPHSPVAESDFQFTRYQDHVLPARRGMPIDKRAARLLSKDDMLGRLRPPQHRMFCQALFFQVGVAVRARVHSENGHGIRLP